jgi:hypothetical protein
LTLIGGAAVAVPALLLADRLADGDVGRVLEEALAQLGGRIVGRPAGPRRDGRAQHGRGDRFARLLISVDEAAGASRKR